MRLAMELLSKHNLDLDQISSALHDRDVVEWEVVLKLDPWIRTILQAACKLYYTRFFMRPIYRGYFGDRKEWHPTFVGSEENISVTTEVAQWLIKSVRLESNAHFHESYERRSFRSGAADRIFERANLLISEEKSAGPPTSTNSLMVLRNKLEKANQNYLDNLHLGNFKSRGSYYDSDAYGRGEAFGNTVNLGQRKKLKAITMSGLSTS